VLKLFQKCYQQNKELQKEISSDLMQCTQNEADLLKLVITCEKT